ncbi:MAG: hypothetical protein IPK82_09410 [Polyangiaceae bacterium]|nr:hypothetical protein [Polyangiaceae bacterium]
MCRGAPPIAYNRHVVGSRCTPIAVATLLLFASACDVGGYIEIPNDPSQGGTGTFDTNTGGFGGGGSAGFAGSAAGGASGDSPVLVGIDPTPSNGSTDPPTVAAFEAKLATFAAGARAAVLSVPWNDTNAFANVPGVADFYAKHEKALLLNLRVIDGHVDHRPAELSTFAWNAPETVATAEAAVDTLLTNAGNSARFFTFGRQVDVYLSDHPDERPGFVAFAKALCAYTKAHPGAPKDLAVGVGFSTSAPKNEAAWSDLIDFEDVIDFSYFPGIDTFAPSAAADVAATLFQLAETVGKKTIVLSQVGFSTNPFSGGSTDAQQKFFTTLFGAVIAQRSRFALVNVVELHDAPTSSCAQWATDQGDTADGPLAAYVCSLGLFEQDGSPRPAWNAVLSGSAALSTP